MAQGKDQRGAQTFNLKLKAALFYKLKGSNCMGFNWPSCAGSELFPFFLLLSLQKAKNPMKHISDARNHYLQMLPRVRKTLLPFKPKFVQQEGLLNRFSMASRPLPTLGKWCLLQQHRRAFQHRHSHSRLCHLGTNFPISSIYTTPDARSFSVFCPIALWQLTKFQCLTNCTTH